METDFTMIVFDELNEPVELEIFLRFNEEDAICIDWVTGENTFKPLFSSEIINIKATQKGNPYKITDDDSDEWDTEIHAACEKQLSRFVDSRRSA